MGLNSKYVLLDHTLQTFSDRGLSVFFAFCQKTNTFLKFFQLSCSGVFYCTHLLYNPVHLKAEEIISDMLGCYETVTLDEGQ